MEKILRTLTWGGIFLILAGAVSCNLPFFSPEGGENGDEHVPVNPEAPTNTDGAETILIPAGTFWMGSEAADTDADADEMPWHQVTLDGFYLYTHEVTNEMYAECVAAGGCLPINVMESGPTTHYADPAYADFPVVGVDWNMADDYCTWAGGRLPTEAEWELAARGTESLPYPWGAEDPACDRVNMLGCAIPPDTVEVGSYLLGNSPEGVWDMSGNVWEWVHDWYDEDYYLFSASWNPLGPYAPENMDDPLKVARGGGLYSEPLRMRSATRAGADPYRAYDDVGFRCVAGEGLALPDGYTPPLDRHDMVPPDPLDGGGDPVEDPDPEEWYSIGFGIASCPTPDGRMHIVLEADSSEEVDYEVTVDGIPFDCYYDEMLRLLHCEGPVPETTEYPDEYHALVWFNDGLIGHFYIDKPTDCDTFAPEMFSIDLECPEDGLFTIDFYYDPPIIWDIVQISGVDLACVQLDDYLIRCTAPDIRVGDHYEFYLHGTGEDGTEYEWMPWVPVRDDCPGLVRILAASPFCFEDHPTVQVMYGDGWPPLGEVWADDVDLDCIGMAPGVQICGDLTQPAGTDVEIQICFVGIECISRTISVPDCPSPDATLGYLIEPYCYPPEDPAPAVSIHYWPFDLPVVAANANGFDLTCENWGGGWYMCPGVPGAPGAETTITFCLEDGRCFSDPMTIPDCAPTGDEGWRMIAIGCHDETRIYFMIETGLDWLFPGVDFDYTATDGETTYACTVNPAMPGRIYCAGPRPEVPGPLEFCLQGPGEVAPTCQTYPDYNIWVAAIPPCAPEEPEEPHVPSCADYTDEYTCNNLHKGECAWNYETGVCEDYP
ncbi:MAG: formylglycine-generating enzyme family protein [Chloroflexota bacterium]